MKMSRRTCMSTGALMAGGLLLGPNSLVKALAAPADAPAWGKWVPGEMHIHFILTGVGESMFHIYPDGTTMLLDAGGRNALAYGKNVGLYPDGSRHSGEWIARYIHRVNPNGKRVDYMMTSHFHDDHCGGAAFYSAKTEGRGEDYYLSGLPEVAEYVDFTTALDRGFPDYNDPRPITCHEVVNMRRFYAWKTREQNGGLKLEKFEVGRENQVALRRNPEAFPTFATRNICANARVWTGADTGVVDYAAASRDIFEKSHNENLLSIAMTVQYGKFRYFTGGDLSGNVRSPEGGMISIEEPAGLGAGAVDVCKTNHHSYRDAMVPGFIKHVRPRVYVSNVWDQLHLQDNTMTNMTSRELYPGDRLVCPTCVIPGRLDEFRDRPWVSDLATDCGHVVLRVFDGGDRFEIYYLDASDEQMRIKKVYGPFQSGANRA